MEQILGQIHLWQMAVDLCLVAAILIFTFRWVRGDRAHALHPRTMELETSLRNLIVEAEGAGQHLNDQLLKREQGLQKLLDEISAIDKKIQVALAAGEQQSSVLVKEETKARAVIAELQGILKEFRDQLAGDTDRDPQVERVPVAPSQDIPAREPAAQVSTRQVYRDNMGHKELQQVYAAAETMLKQGQELSQVSAKTRLPVEEVQLLSQMIEVESQEVGRKAKKSQPVGPTDERLGALGGIRRHNATL